MDINRNNSMEEKIQNLSNEEKRNETIDNNDISLGNSDESDARSFTATSIVNKLTPKKSDSLSSSTHSTSSHDDQEEKILWESGCSKEAEEYNMRHKRRGMALIFNHSEFARMSPRRGTNKDCQDLQVEIKALGFDVIVHHDLTYRQLKSVLEETSKKDHSDADCLLVVVMTHGEPGTLYTKDLPYKEQELWKKFTGDKCESLVGKPKLFFIQACRGDQVDSGVRMATTVTDAVSTTYMIPTQADILLAYSTVPGYYSWRSPLKGSWYIQALCAELNANGQKRDLLTLLTFVNRRVAIDYMSTVPGNYKMDMKNQMPAITSMLTRLVYFHDNSGKNGQKVKTNQ